MKKATFITSILLNIILLAILVFIIFSLAQIGLIFQDENELSATQIAPTISQSIPDSFNFELEVIAENLEIPWAVAHVDENTKLLTERPGRVRLVQNNELVEKPVYVVPNVQVAGEAGLMSMVLHPQFDENQQAYIYFAYSTDSGDTALKVSRFEFTGESFINEKTIIDNIPYGQFHAGGELKFGPDNALYITTGDVTDGNLSQNPLSLAGKTLRLNDDGSTPWDNPFVDNDDVLDPIYSFGHRNSQGIAWHPTTLQQYQSDHGPSGFDGGTGMDEINFVKKGANYGWPLIRGEETADGLETPMKSYSPAIAPASIEFYEGAMFPELNGLLLVAGLRGENILVLEIEEDEIVNESRLFETSEIGRIREISIGSDGSIYFTTSNTDGRGDPPREGDDKVYRIFR